jgi:predicted site-specific integrase-resolvase
MRHEQLMDTLMNDVAGLTWAARTLEIGEKTARVWADKGRIPMVARLPDGSRLFQRSVITKMAAARRKPSA